MDLQQLFRVFVAMLGGLAVGIERQWSGHASGPHARLGGVRTFTLLGALAGASGLLWQAGLAPLGVVILGAAGALVAIGYARASRDDIDATTEVAAVVILASGTLAGIGQIQPAMAIVAIALLMLVEKTRLHRWTSQLNDTGVAAGARFAVMALVILPLLPHGPFGPFGAIQPRLLWALVLFFSGLSFASYLIRRLIGASQGFAVTGLLGGFVSSTSTTLTLSKESQVARSPHGALASGVMAANAMLFVRVSIAAGVLAPELPLRLLPAFAAPFVVAAGLAVFGMRTKAAGRGEKPADDNPLRFAAALEMAVLFQVVLILVAWIRRSLGTAGVFGSAAVLGLTDVDALTVSMAKSIGAGTTADVAALALVIGILANTVVKLGLVLVLGRGRFRLWAGAGLAMIGAALGAYLLVALRG